jgi:hypothetical protein
MEHNCCRSDKQTIHQQQQTTSVGINFLPVDPCNQPAPTSALTASAPCPIVVVCTRPPVRLRLSRTVTEYPLLHRSYAALRPLIPAPITMTSCCCCCASAPPLPMIVASRRRGIIHIICLVNDQGPSLRLR